MKFRVPTPLQKKCHRFATNSLPTSSSVWGKDGVGEDKMRQDIITGKLGEYAISSYLKMRGFKCSEPSLEVFQGRKKSFSADLVANLGIRIHCKSQTMASANKYGISWLIQHSPTRKDPLIAKATELDYLAFSLVNDDGVVEILGIYKVLDLLKHNLFVEPAVEWFRYSKRAIYFSHIEKCGLSKLESL